MAKARGPIVEVCDLGTNNTHTCHRRSQFKNKTMTMMNVLDRSRLATVEDASDAGEHQRRHVWQARRNSPARSRPRRRQQLLLDSEFRRCGETLVPTHRWRRRMSEEGSETHEGVLAGVQSRR